MQARHRDLLNIVRSVDGVEIVDSYTTNGRAEVKLRAANGQTRKFFLSLRGVDLKDSINTKRGIIRFAAENSPPPADAKPATPEQIETLKAMQTTPAPTKRPTLTLQQKPAVPEAERALSNVEFFNLTMWVQQATLFDYADADACAAAASVKFDLCIGAETIRQIVSMLKLTYPTAWDGPPLDPQVVLADQMAAIMTELGVTPTADFLRLAKQLHKE